MSCMYLAHHELKSNVVMIIISNIIMIIITIVIFIRIIIITCVW